MHGIFCVGDKTDHDAEEMAANRVTSATSAITAELAMAVSSIVVGKDVRCEKSRRDGNG